MSDLYWNEAAARDMRGVLVASAWAGQNFKPREHMYETAHLLPPEPRKLTQKEIDDLERGIAPAWLVSGNSK